MNMPPSAEIIRSFASANVHSLRRAAIFASLSFLPSMFAANGPPPVTVTQPVNVQVINSDTAPVQTQDVDNPAFQPFQHKQEFSYLEGSLGRAASVAVPPGKRLVIEFISVFAILPT